MLAINIDVKTNLQDQDTYNINDLVYYMQDYQNVPFKAYSDYYRDKPISIIIQPYYNLWNYKWCNILDPNGNLVDVVYSTNFSFVAINYNNLESYTLQIVLETKYNVELSYDENMGGASYRYMPNGISFSSYVYTHYRFLQWEFTRGDTTDTVYTNNITLIPSSDLKVVAVFERIYNVNLVQNEHGTIDFKRSSSNGNAVLFSAIPNTHYNFLQYVYNFEGEEQQTSDDPSLELTLTNDITITANFYEDDKSVVEVNANIANASIYVSHGESYEPFDCTIYARPMADYEFVQWDDGVTENPREMYVDTRVVLTAIYRRLSYENQIMQYRCYVKEQLNLTDPPKAFMKVDSFNIKEDYLTTSNSTIHVLEVASNVNNGDVLVLYDYTGKTLYQGVIKSIQDLQINCSQMQSYYKGNFRYHNISNTANLEEELKALMTEYSEGKIFGSSWTDPLIAKRLGGITIRLDEDETNRTDVHLPTSFDKRYKDEVNANNVMEMESFIYSLYESYGIAFVFEINFEGENYLTIKVPKYESMKVGNNMYAIKDMTPMVSIEETNRLIIFTKNRTYRKTYVATKNGIVEEPESLALRFNVTNTNIVFSDDAFDDLVAANLPNTMYNHKLTFSLILRNFVYEYDDFKMGKELEVWYNDDYYKTVLTGYEINKDSNVNVTEVKFTCGLVRVALTKLITMGRY